MKNVRKMLQDGMFSFHIRTRGTAKELLKAEHPYPPASTIPVTRELAGFYQSKNMPGRIAQVVSNLTHRHEFTMKNR
jgi:hypothetical protein